MKTITFLTEQEYDELNEELVKLLTTTIVNTVISSLSNRNGFDDWWGNIDDSIQQEIIEELIDLVIEQLETK